MWIKKVSVLVCVIVSSVYCESKNFNGIQIMEHTLNECFGANERYSCISNNVARIVERSMDSNVPLMDGVTLVRNNETVNYRQARLLGFDRLSQAVQNYFKTHVISLELGDARRLESGKGGDEGGGYGGFGGGGGIDMKTLEKEKKYTQYAFMVLLGIFGLTGPLVMKVLALMAAKAILAAKTALIIVGSVALKKLFEKDHQEPSIKVHTINHDHDSDDEDHDRISKIALTGYGYDSSPNTWHYNNPYGSYYDDYYTYTAAKNHNMR